VPSAVLEEASTGDRRLLNVLRVQRVDVGHEEAMGRAIDGVRPLARGSIAESRNVSAKPSSW
jgi:hypothetical protein